MIIRYLQSIYKIPPKRKVIHNGLPNELQMTISVNIGIGMEGNSGGVDPNKCKMWYSTVSLSQAWLLQKKFFPPYTQ